MEFLSNISGIYLSDFSDPAFWMAVGSIILIDLILSGDNAILIAMACRNLPPEHRKKGIIYGTAGAIGLRMVFGALIIYLLKIPFIQAFGALLLVWIAVKLLIQQNDHEIVDAPTQVWQAVKTIIIADAVMSLDNVLALAGVADGKPGLLWFGLIISIPLVLYGSRIFLTMIDKFPSILYVGSGILGWTAGKMLIQDPKLISFLKGLSIPPVFIGETFIAIVFTALVLVAGWSLNMLQKRKEANCST